MILQKILAEKSPWHMLVGCCLLNLTSREQVDKVWPELFEKFGDSAEDFELTFGAFPGKRKELTGLLRPLGLGERRKRTLLRLTKTYLDELDRVGYDLHSVCLDNVFGCGKYAKDSWDIFVLGKHLDPQEVTDKVLKAWLEDKELEG